MKLGAVLSRRLSPMYERERPKGDATKHREIKSGGVACPLEALGLAPILDELLVSNPLMTGGNHGAEEGTQGNQNQHHPAPMNALACQMVLFPVASVRCRVLIPTPR